MAEKYRRLFDVVMVPRAKFSISLKIRLRRSEVHTQEKKKGGEEKVWTAVKDELCTSMQKREKSPYMKFFLTAHFSNPKHSECAAKLAERESERERE